MALEKSNHAIRTQIVGTVGPYEVVVVGNRVSVALCERIVIVHEVRNLDKFLRRYSGKIRITHARLDEQFDIIGLWAPDGFGYALNLQAPELSEWGYSG